MRDLNDFNEDIYKCSKCGLCRAVCPVFRVLKDECSLSRGKFIILNGIASGKIKFSRSVAKSLALCTSCGKCSDFCPSNIDAVRIFSAAKHEILKKSRFSRFLSSVGFFEFKLKLINAFVRLYRFFSLHKLVRSASPLFLKFKFKFPVYADDILHKYALSSSAEILNPIRKNIVFFKGCFNNYINDSSLNSSLNLLKSLGIHCLLPDFPCCGITKYFDGNFEDFRKNALRIIDLIPENLDYIISDCATCINALNTFASLFPEAAFLKNKILSIEEFLLLSGFSKTFHSKYKVTYHKPCHGVDLSNQIPLLMKNIEFIPIEHDCCGFAGEFSLLHPSISSEIAAHRASTIIDSGAEYVITSCPSCIAGLKKSLCLNVKVLSVSEFLNLD